MRRGITSLAALLLAASAACPGMAQMTERKTDAEVYLKDNPPPEVSSTAANSTYLPYQGDHATPRSGYAIPKASYYERVLAVWKDPFTLPHSRSECVKWASGHIPFDGDWKTCIGWAVQWQWMYDRAILTADAPNVGDIEKAVQQCLGTAAVAAAAAAIVSGGTVAIGVFEGVMKGCLTTTLGSSIGVHVRTESYWGDWE